MMNDYSILVLILSLSYQKLGDTNTAKLIYRSAATLKPDGVVVDWAQHTMQQAEMH